MLTLSKIYAVKTIHPQVYFRFTICDFRFMVPALATPIELLLRRNPFIFQIVNHQFKDQSAKITIFRKLYYQCLLKSDLRNNHGGTTTPGNTETIPAILCAL